MKHINNTNSNFICALGALAVPVQRHLYRAFFASLVLALIGVVALVFTACGGAPQTASAVPAQAAEDTSGALGDSDAVAADKTDKAAQGSELVLLTNETGMLRETQDGFYRTILPRNDGSLFMTFFDYNTQEQRYLCNVSGCAHDGDACGAFLKTKKGSSVTPFLLGDVLYYVYDAYPDPAKPETEWVAAIERRKPDGTQPQLVAQGNAWSEFRSAGRIYSDGAALYTVSGADNTRLLRIDLATGALTDVPWDNVSLFPIDAPFGRSLLALENVGTAQKQVSLYAVSVDDGAKTLLHTWEKGVFGLLTQTLQNGKLVYVNLTTRELWAYDPATDSQALLTSAFAHLGEPQAKQTKPQSGMDREKIAAMQAEGSIKYPAVYWHAVFAGDWIFLANTGGDDPQALWAHNLQTSETTQVTLTDVWNAAERPLTVHAATPSGILVTQEHRTVQVKEQDKSGLPISFACEYEVFALMNPADLASSQPNFRTIQPVEYKSA